MYNTVHQILTNPIYAGAYAYGRTTRRTIIDDGRQRVVHETRRHPAGLEGVDPRPSRGLYRLG